VGWKGSVPVKSSARLSLLSSLSLLTKLPVGVVHQPALDRGLAGGGGKAGHDSGIHLHDGLRPAAGLDLGHGHNRLDGDESQGRGDQGEEDSTLHG